MRSSATIFLALFITSIATCASAQYHDVDPRMLPDQIRDQQIIVNSAAGKQDGDAWLKLAVLLQDAGQFGASERVYQRTLELMKSRDPLVVADVLDHMGTMYAVSGQLAKAEPLERTALSTREAKHDLLGAGVSHMHLALLLLGEHDLRSAETEANKAVDLLVPEGSPSSVETTATPEEKMTALIDLSLVRCTLNRCSSAVPELQRALNIARANYPDNSVPVGYTEFLLGYVHWKSGDSDGGEELMSKGVHELATQIGWGHPMYLRTLRQYRVFLDETGRASEAGQVSAELSRLEQTQPPAAHSGGADLASKSPR